MRSRFYELVYFMVLDVSSCCVVCLDDTELPSKICNANVLGFPSGRNKTFEIGFEVLATVVMKSLSSEGRAIAEAFSRWLPTAAARVQSRVWSSGICGGQNGVGTGFLRVLRFPLPFIPPISPSSQSPGAGTIGQ
jgi:hypothetical protein